MGRQPSHWAANVLRIMGVSLHGAGMGDPKQSHWSGTRFFRGLLFFHGRESAEKQAANVGQDRGTARRNAVFGEKRKKLSEGVMDALGRVETVVIAGKDGGETGGAALLLDGAMART